jgi:hypothetical protein
MVGRWRPFQDSDPLERFLGGMTRQRPSFDAKARCECGQGQDAGPAEVEAAQEPCVHKAAVTRCDGAGAASVHERIAIGTSDVRSRDVENGALPAR